MRNEHLLNPVDALVERLAGRPPAALFWIFTIGAAVGGVTAGLISFVVVRLIARIRELQGQLEHSARTDELTGLPNRRVLFEVLAREIERVGRRDAELTVVFVDLDRFKRVNDQHGHQVGDAVLREAAAVMRSGLRTYDIVGCYGGEEFVMVLPDTGAWAWRISQRAWTPTGC